MSEHTNGEAVLPPELARLLSSPDATKVVHRLTAADWPNLAAAVITEVTVAKRKRVGSPLFDPAKDLVQDESPKSKRVRRPPDVC